MILKQLGDNIILIYITNISIVTKTYIYKNISIIN